MKNKAIVLAAICLTLMITLSGCRECDTDEDCEEEGFVCDEDGVCVETVVAALDIYVGGTDGIVGTFASPDKLYVGDSINVFSFDVENKGEYTIPVGALSVYLGAVRWSNWGVTGGDGYDVDSGTLVASTSFDIEGAFKSPTGEELPGDTETLDFDVNEDAAVASLAGATERVLATMCYPYMTNGTAWVCTGKISKGAAAETHCDFQGEKETVSSGAPLQVTKVEETTSGETSDAPTHRFIITIENVGDGIPYLSDSVATGSNCVVGLDRKDEGKFKIESISLGTTPISISGSKCDFTGSNAEHRLIDNKREITCSYTYSSALAAAEEPLHVVLSYNYKDESVVREYKVEG